MSWKTILNSKEKVFLFLILLPVVAFIIRIQFYLCIIITFLLIVFIIYCLIFKKNIVLRYPHEYIIIENIWLYLPYKVFVEIPVSRSYLTVYYFLETLKKSSKINKTHVLSLIVALFFLFLFRLTFLLIVGFTYYVALKTADCVKIYFELKDLNYENNNAWIQTLIINIFLVDFIFEHVCMLKIHLNSSAEKEKITLNPEYFEFFKFKDIGLLFKALIPNNDINHKFLFIKHFKNSRGHYYGIYTNYDNSKMAGSNFTHTPTFTIKNKNNQIEQQENLIGIKPNIKGENKINYITPVHEIDYKNSVISSVSYKELFMLQKHNSLLLLTLLFSSDKSILIYNDSYYRPSNMSIFNYAKYYNFPVYKNILYYEQFKLSNSEFLKTDEGKLLFEQLKFFLISNPSFYTKLSKNSFFNKFDN